MTEPVATDDQQGRPAYVERLTAPVSLWLVAAVLVVLLAVTIGAALGPYVGVPLLLLVGGAVGAVLVRSAAVVAVEHGTLRAGRASIPLTCLGPVEVLDADRARAVRGPESDPAAYHLIRGWVPAGVRAPVTDPADPTPYWFVASRRPDQLARAIEAARG